MAKTIKLSANLYNQEVGLEFEQFFLKIYVKNLFPAPSICSITRDLKDSGGAYIKSLCSIYQDKTYDQAVAFCSANGMKIFNADVAEVESALTSFSNMQWPVGTFYVEGKSGTSCNVLSDAGRVTFAKSTVLCTVANHFHCEYNSEFFLESNLTINIIF